MRSRRVTGDRLPWGDRDRDRRRLVRRRLVRRRGRDDRGQAVPLVVLVVALAALAALAAGAVGAGLVDRQRARQAADAAALAGLSGGRTATERVAAANGATLVSFMSRPTGGGVGVVVEVVVRVGGSVATSRATNGP